MSLCLCNKRPFVTIDVLLCREKKKRQKKKVSMLKRDLDARARSEHYR